MRFGIMAMQMDALIPGGLQTENVMAHVANFEHVALVTQLVNQGFDLIELGGDLQLFLPQTFSNPEIAKLAELKTRRGLTYTLHLPLWSVEPSTPLETVRLGSVQAIVDSIQSTAILEPEIYVLHATGGLAAEFYRMPLSEQAHHLLLTQFKNNARLSIETILVKTGIPSRKLAVETVEFPFDMTLNLAEELDLSICLDTGHILVGFSGPIDLFDALEQSLPRLGEVHLHDGPWQGLERKIGYGKDHQPLGKGDLPVGRLLDRLEQANYQGPIIFELRVPEAQVSMAYIQKIRPNILQK
jgi:sugar phosphate isomerase/epimerase